jgi:hypothetical protein
MREVTDREALKISSFRIASISHPEFNAMMKRRCTADADDFWLPFVEYHVLSHGFGINKVLWRVVRLQETTRTVNNQQSSVPQTWHQQSALAWSQAA